MSLRIAVLDNNPSPGPLARRFPNDGDKVVAALSPLRPHWRFDVWAAKRGELPPDPGAYDGWVLTGSIASANDDLPWVQRLVDLLRLLHDRRVPMAGLCFGHQVIARALGGRVGPSPGGLRLGVATTRLHHRERWMTPMPPEVTLFAAHQEQVLVPPAGARVLGGDDWAPVGAMALGDHVFSTQYHPELSREFLCALVDEQPAVFPAEVAARARVQFERPVDAGLFMRWIAQFLERCDTGAA